MRRLAARFRNPAEPVKAGPGKSLDQLSWRQR